MRLLLVEDNRDLATLLTERLGASGFAVDVLGLGMDAHDVLRRSHYSAVILDLGLPDCDGLSILKALRARKDATPVLVLTARGGLHDRVAGLQDGADDYLVKPFAFEELIARLRAVLRRPGELLGPALTAGNVMLDIDCRQVFVNGRPEVFSLREGAALEILMRRLGRVVSKQLVEDQLYGLSEDIGSNAVEVCVHRLRKQLAEVGATVQIHTIRGVGYLLKSQEA
jgi:DNA-binding response OmpR family regulator